MDSNQLAGMANELMSGKTIFSTFFKSIAKPKNIGDEIENIYKCSSFSCFTRRSGYSIKIISDQVKIDKNNAFFAYKNFQTGSEFLIAGDTVTINKTAMDEIKDEYSLFKNRHKIPTYKKIFLFASDVSSWASHISLSIVMGIIAAIIIFHFPEVKKIIIPNSGELETFSLIYIFGLFISFLNQMRIKVSIVINEKVIGITEKKTVGIFYFLSKKFCYTLYYS
ncbi:hypothetical protein, partial [Acidithiobacillus ferridurans]